MKQFPKIAIIYLSFNPEPYIEDVIAALKKITYPKDRLEFIVVDNPHPDYGSAARFLSDTLLPLSGKELPPVTILPQETNLGFAGGNNVGIKLALERGCDYVFFHNNDGFMAANCFEPLVTAMESDKTIGAAQPLIILYPETDLINTDGNALHYLMIGYCNNFRVPRYQVKLPVGTDTGYGSGAALMMRADLLKKHGLWDEDFWLYHEDIEYSLRLKSLGYRLVMVSNSIFFHKYSFSRNAEKFYYIERNRFGTMLMFYKWPTLLLLLPIGILFELGLILFSLRQGWLSTKLRAYVYWLNPAHWRVWLAKRHRIQANRTVSDRVLLRHAVGSVHFEEKSINNPLLRYLGNPLLAGYWLLVKKMIVW